MPAPPRWVRTATDHERQPARPPPRRQDKAQPSISSSSIPLPGRPIRSEEHTSELQSLMRISYAVFCLKKKTSSTSKLNQYIIQTIIRIHSYPRQINI